MNNFLRRTGRLLAILTIFLATATAARAADEQPEAPEAMVRINSKRLIILRPGIDTLWGSYVFAVQNLGKEPATLKAQIDLPKETVDFQPQEGLSPEEVQPGAHSLSFAKSFPPGTQVISIGFRVNAALGQSVFTLAPAETINNLTVLVPRRGTLSISAPQLALANADEAPDPEYKAFISAQPLEAGQSLVVSVNGVPEGRGRIWIVGGMVAGLLVIVAFFLAWRTRPKIQESSTEALITG